MEEINMERHGFIKLIVGNPDRGVSFDSSAFGLRDAA